MGGGIDSARETGDDDVTGLAQLARDIFCKPPPVGGYISRTDDPHCRAFEHLHVAAQEQDWGGSAMAASVSG